MEKLISVIVPCYNCQEYLDECVHSIIEQTYSNIEVILIDDASTDSTADICDRYPNIDSRIKVFHQNENSGRSSARNVGLQEMKGDYYMFVDADDVISSTIVKKY